MKRLPPTGPGNVAMIVREPLGGFKQSGFFGRDKSIFAHYQYTELKTVWMQLA